VDFAKQGLALQELSHGSENDTYWPGLHEELSIAGNYSRDPAEKDRGFAACNWLALNRDVSSAQRNLARSNLRFYLEAASKIMPSFTPHPVVFTAPDGYRPTNPSVTRWGNDILLAQRCVNFVLTENNEYETPNDAPIHTRNFLLRLNEDLETQSAI